MKIEMLVWHIRATKGISLRTLSLMSGISKSTINRIENNKTIPRAENGKRQPSCIISLIKKE